jgi:small subunit ribosomal protein S6
MAIASAIPAHRAREYETIYIVRPNAGEEAAEEVSNRIVEAMERLNGRLVKVDVWGRRRLAYKIKGHGKGVFIYLRYLGYPGLVEEMERNFRMLDAVLKYQTVKLSHETDPETVEIDPEAVTFQKVDFSDEPEDEGHPETQEEARQGDGYLDYEPEPIDAAAAAAAAAKKADVEPAAEAKAEAPAEAAAEAKPAEAPAEAAAEAKPAEAPAEAAAEAPAEAETAEAPAEATDAGEKEE